MGVFQSVNNQVLTTLSAPLLSGARLTRQQRRQAERQQLQDQIIRELRINPAQEADYVVFRFNDLTEKAQRHYVWLFRHSTRHATILDLSYPQLLALLQLINPMIWGGGWGSILTGSETPRWRVNNISSWLYQFLKYPDRITSGEGVNSHSRPISTHNRRLNQIAHDWVETGIEPV